MEFFSLEKNVADIIISGGDMLRFTAGSSCVKVAQLTRLRAHRSLLPHDLLDKATFVQALSGATFHFFHSRSYDGRRRAPRGSIPSVSIAKASGASFSFTPSTCPGFGYAKVPCSSRLIITHSPFPSQ